MSPLLSLRNVWVEYGDKIVLEKVSIDIEAGSFVSIVGPSGAGKSSLLRLILGQEAPTQGDLLNAAKARRQRGLPVVSLGAWSSSWSARHGAGCSFCTAWPGTAPWRSCTAAPHCT